MDILLEFNLWLESTVAYMAWISPEGRVIADQGQVAGRGRHIHTMIDNPEIFGFTADEIAATYKRHKEIMGQEGNAREELILKAVSNGWIRIRRYLRPDQYSVNVNQINQRSMRRLEKWAMEMLGQGKYTTVSIVPIQGPPVTTNIGGLATGQAAAA